MPEQTILRKSYSTAFVLDRGKLTRIMQILEQRMPETGVSFEPAFKLKLRSGKELLLHYIQELFALDNTVKNSIAQLEIQIPPGTEFQGRVALRYDSDHQSNISIVVGPSPTKWATEVFAELEEQVERTFSTSWIYRYVSFGLSGLFSVFTAASAFVAFITVLFSSGPPLPHHASTLLQRAFTASTDQEKLQVIFDKTVNDLAAEARQHRGEMIDVAALLSWRTLFMALPVVVVLGALVYLARVCYPWAVFAWGDWEQQYTELVARRKPCFLASPRTCSSLPFLL